MRSPSRRAVRLRKLIVDYVRSQVRGPVLAAQQEWLEQLAQRPPVEQVDVVGALRESQRERDEELAAAHRR